LKDFKHAIKPSRTYSKAIEHSQMHDSIAPPFVAGSPSSSPKVSVSMARPPLRLQSWTGI
jgi:hypothetical protein